MTTQDRPAPIYVPIRTDMEHINRHFAGSLTPGSKFLPMDDALKNAVLDRVEMALSGRFDAYAQNGLKPPRVVFQAAFDKAIGTDALVEIAAGKEKDFSEVIRDGGTPHEVRVKVKETDQMPTTNFVTVIAGPYGPTGKWGIYTMYPGGYAEDFPRPERQSPELLATNTAFWERHGFLATRQEIQASMAAPAAP